MKVYASAEWLAEGKKKYRRVFESIETSYLYVELSFFNKLFDEQDWQARARLKCFRLSEQAMEELCDLEVTCNVPKDEHIIYLREGWGHEEAGFFWKRGDYQWDAYIDDELVGSTRFHIEDGGIVSLHHNPYFDIRSIRFFEGGNDGRSLFHRRYLTDFEAVSTRYIWAELTIENHQEHTWFCELFFNFYNGAGQLKGTTVELRQITPEEVEAVIVTGWGADVPGTWYEGPHTLEVVFMDQLIALAPFHCGLWEEDGTPHIITGEELLIQPKREGGFHQEKRNETLAEVMTELNSLVGLKEIKQKITDYTEYLEFLKLRKEKGMETEHSINLHTVFTGNPGTGKTTVARLMARAYHCLGLLSQGHVVEVGRAELIGQYIGQTAPKVKEVIEQARGGVLFIDEAYALVRNDDDEKDYGHEVIEILVKEMADGPGDMAVFAAGYPQQMEVFLQSNPGLKSRFGIRYDFPDYLPQELIQIADTLAKAKNVKFSDAARELMAGHLTRLFRKRDHSFGNARMVDQLIEATKIHLGLRVMRQYKREELTEELLSAIELADVQKALALNPAEKPVIPTDEELLAEALGELEQLRGLESVKKEVLEIVQLVQFYREEGREVMGHFPLHTVLKGNPGTGKTTVARIMAKVYKALGILERGELVECGRQDLVAGYVGQTAIKTQAILAKAKGSVLFIDEAYALNRGDGTHSASAADFGNEAIEVLLKEMEENRAQLIVFVAGYTQPMERFLDMNPGLKSRFDRTLVFEDYSAQTLYEIALSQLAAEQLQPDQQAGIRLQEYFAGMVSRKDSHFGNGREVRKSTEKLIKIHHLRLAATPAPARTPEAVHTLALQDVEAFIHAAEEKTANKTTIGFTSAL